MTHLRDSAVQSLWMVGAGLSFALMALCIKAATDDMGVFELGLWRSIGGTIVIYALLRMHKETIALRHPATHFYRAAWGMAAVLMFYYAIDVLEPSIAYALNYTAPIVFIILSALHLRERLNAKILLAAIGCFAGVLLLLRPDLDASENIASAIGIASGLCAAMAFLMIRKLGQLGEGGLRTVFFLNVHGTVFCVVALGVAGDFQGLTPDTALPVLGVVVFATTGQLALTRALAQGSSAASAALSYSGVFFSVLIDALLRDIHFTVRDYAGFALIVGFGSLSVWMARAKSKIDVPL